MVAQKTPKNVRLDALSLRRALPTITVPLAKIRPSEWCIGPDPAFARLYKEYLLGKRTVYATRMSLKRIRCGFYSKNANNELEYRCDRPPADVVADSVHLIRQGLRSPLHIYANPNAQEEQRFVAPDDVPMFLAYQLLGVRKVPVLLFSALERRPEEAALGFKVFNVASHCSPSHIVSTHPGCSGKVPAFVGPQAAEDTIASLCKLREKIAGAQVKVKQFHVQGDNTLHYHHTLYSTLARMDQTLDAVILLLERELWHEAVPLLRTLYENSLNFYVDWLAPQSIHAFFAIAAVLDRKRLQDFILSVSTFERADGGKVMDPKVRAAVTRTFDLIRVVRNKAELSPLGLRFYKNMYSFMSGVAHQDFDVVAQFAHMLEREDRPKFAQRTMQSLLMSADVIVAKVVLRVLEDVGQIEEAAEVSQENC